MAQSKLRALRSFFLRHQTPRAQQLVMERPPAKTAKGFRITRIVMESVMLLTNLPILLNLTTLISLMTAVSILMEHKSPLPELIQALVAIAVLSVILICEMETGSSFKSRPFTSRSFQSFRLSSFRLSLRVLAPFLSPSRSWALQFPQGFWLKPAHRREYPPKALTRALRYLQLSQH